MVVICPFVYRSSIIFSFPSSFGDVAVVVVVVAFFGETNIRVKSRYTNQQQKKEESKWN